MAEYEVELESGEVITIEGVEGMTDQEVIGLVTQYMEQGAAAPDPERDLSALDYAKGTAETVATLGTGAAAEVASGLLGLAGGLGLGMQGEEGDYFAEEEAGQIIEHYQDLLTYQPRTEAGRRQLQTIGETIGPVFEAISTLWKEKAADPAFEATGSPAVGAAVGTFPTAAMEVMGLKGGRSARRGLSLAGLRKAPVSEIASLYDETGKLLPMVEDALRIKLGKTPEGVGLARQIDPSEARRAAERSMSEPNLARTGQTIAEAARRPDILGGQGQRKKLAAFADPDERILQAAKELGVDADLLPSHFAQNPTYVAIEQGLKSVPASDLSVREAGTIAALAKKADEFIVEFGGDTRRADVSENFRLDSEMLVDELGNAADDAYDAVRDAIPADAEVATSNTVQMIMDEAEELGGVMYLDSAERRLLESLDPRSKPTYKRLDRERKKIGQALNRNSGPYKDADAGALKRTYKALKEDQRAAAATHGADELYDAASGIVAQRKSIEDQLVKVLGKNLAGDVTKKAGKAVVGLSKGETEAFTTLLKNIPEMLGKESRREIVMTALNDALTMGSRKEKSLHIPGFDDFMNGMKKNGTDKLLAKEIGPEAMKRLETLHTVVSSVRKAQERAITTGRVLAVPKFDLKGLADRAYGAARTVGRALPGTPDFLAGPRTPRHLAADAMLADREFLKYMVDAAAGRLENSKDMRKAQRAMMNNKAYNKWLKTLDEPDMRDVLSLGIVNFMRGKGVRQTEKEE